MFSCNLHFWQNDRDFLRATVVTRGWNGYRNKSQHRKSTLEKKILPPFQQGFEPATFQSRVRCSNHWAIPAPWFWFLSTLNISWFLFITGCAIQAISLVCLDGFISLYVVLLSVLSHMLMQHITWRGREREKKFWNQAKFCYFSAYDHW